MADVMNLLIKIGTQADIKGLQETIDKIEDAGKKVKLLTESFKIVGGALTAFAASGIIAFTDFTKAAMEQEDATRALSTALKNYYETHQKYRTEIIKEGNTYRDIKIAIQDKHKVTVESLQQIATELQGMTTIGDEATMQMMTLGLTMGVSADKIGKTTKEAIGLSKGFGIDLTSAMKMVTLAQQGNYDLLTRYIPQLRGVTDEKEKARIATEAFARGFKIAAAETTTLSGKLIQMWNDLGDLKETIGTVLIPVISQFAVYLRDIIKWIQGLNPELIKWVTLITAGAVALSGLLGPILLFIGYLPQILAGIQVIIPILAAIAGPAGWIALLISGVILLSAAWKNNFLGIKDFTVSWWNDVKLIWTSALEFINKIITAYTKVKNLAGKAVNTAVSAIPGFANGVNNFAGGLAMVGERGPELVNLPSGTSIYSNPESRSMLSGGGGITVNVTGNNISSDMDLNKIAETISNKILQSIKNQRVM